MSVGAAEDLLRAVAGAAKLKRLCLRVGQLLNPAWIVARISSAVGTTSYLSDGASNNQRQRKCRAFRGSTADRAHRRRSA
jgi:hypothetical protein